MNNFFDSNKKKDCNGCGACALRCPQEAIRMIEDDEGFLYPQIDKNKCVDCGLCKKVCGNNPMGKNDEQTYIAINKNKEELKKSSSGGMYSILARYVLKQKGIVFGVKYDSNHMVCHDYIDNIKNIEKFRESKYVRSNLGNSYISVEKFLKENKLVLFTGTPCQCAGLRSFLMKDYKNLITCEIICHANASPKIFKMYLKNLELREGKKINWLRFRTKEHGWHGNNTFVEYLGGGTDTRLNGFSRAFQYELINRPSCYDCRFCTIVRYSDFTIGDMWGIEKVAPEIKDDNTGISLLNVNTDKGREVFEQIKDEMFYKKVDTKLAFSNNHNSNVSIHKNRKKFFKEIKNGKINESNIIDYLEKYIEYPIYIKITNKIKRVIKKIVLN